MVQKNTSGVWDRYPRRLFLLVLPFIFATSASAEQTSLFAQHAHLDVMQLTQAVLARNSSIQAMHAAWQAAASRTDQVAALDDPMLSYSVAPETRHAEGQDFGQNIQLSQKLPWPGKLALKGDSARFEADASLDNIDQLRLRLIEAAAQSFADWYYIHKAQRINQDLWIEFKDIAELKYSTGRASKQDAIRAEVEKTMLEHQAIVLQRKQRNILVQLNTLLNQSPDNALPPPAPLPAIKPLPAINELRHRTITQHPALQILIAQQRASEIQIKLATRDYYPDFTVSVGHNSLWNQEEKRWTVGVGMNIPLAQGKRDARLNEMQARALQTKWQITDKQAEIIGAVQRAYHRVEESRHILTLYKDKLLPLAGENLQAAQADYQSGKSSFLDLVSAEKNLIQTQLNHVQAQSDYYRNLATLSSRVGDPGLLDDAFAGLIRTHEVTKGEFP